MPASLEPEPLEPEPLALEFRLLGGCDIRVHGSPLPPPRYRKEWWLLALLVLKHDRELSRDTLASSFWPDSDGDRALLYLRRLLTNLRRALGPESARLLSPTPRTLRFDLSGAFADAVAFDRAVRKTPSHSPSEEDLAQAVELYQGPLLPDCAEEWVLPERAERAQAYLAALEGLAQKATERGDPTTAVHWLRRLVSADPLRESANAALMAALAEGGDRAAVTQVFQDLRRLLRQGLNTEPAPETRALYRRLTEQGVTPPAAAPAPAPSVPSLRHLPIPLSDLIGRAQEIEEVTGWLRRSRLVTLLGTGGAGKTRLAIAAAEAALPRFEAGVWFVDLAPLSSPALVAEAAAKALGIGEEAGQRSEERLTEALSSSSLLLVLDNCEHVLDACAALSSHLLSACPGLRVLATSRQALGVLGEQVYAVPSLRLPPLEKIGPEAEPAHAEKNVLGLLEYEAVRLFVERATQASPAFRLTRRNAESVVEICHHLDGIPLALELAAARVRSLSPAEICARLEDRFRLLVSGNRAAAPRHQTLRAAMDWSYGLLTAHERSVLLRLSVFTGGWRLEAAETVCVGGMEFGGPGAGGSRERNGLQAPGDVFEPLAELVDKSLVVVSESEAGPRYGLLETVRQYARERLHESGEEQEVEQRHAAWALALAEEAEPHLSGAEAAVWLDRLEAEHDNLHTALDWHARQPQAQAEAHLRLAGALTPFWSARGHFRAGRRRLQAALSHAGTLSESSTEPSPSVPPDLPARAKALRGAAILASSQGDYTVARTFFAEALTLRRAIGDPAGIAVAISNLGTVTWLQGDPVAAQALYLESLEVYRELNSTRNIAQALYNLGILAFDLVVGTDDFDAVRPLLEEAITRFGELGDTRGRSYALNALGNLFIELQDYPAAQAIHEENLEIARRLNDPLLTADAQAMLGLAMSRQGDYSAASSLLKEALALRLEMGDKRNAAIALTATASVFAEQGHGVRAARLWGAIEALRETLNFPLRPHQSAAYEKAVSQARDASDGVQFTAAWAAGRALTWEQAVNRALSNMS